MSRKFVFAGLALALAVAPNLVSGQAPTPGATQPGRDTNQSRQPAQARPDQNTPGSPQGSIQGTPVQGGQIQPGQVQVQPGQVQPGQIRPGQVVQPGQVQQVQPGQIQQVQPGQATNNQRVGDQRADDQRGGNRAMSGQNNPALLQHIVLGLTLANRSEVELGQLASQQAKDDRVKDFAKMMIKEHEQMISDLEKVAQNTRGNGRSGNDQQRDSDPNDDRNRTNIPNAVSPSGQSQTGQAQSGQTQTPTQNTTDANNSAGGRSGGAMQGQGGAVIAQLNQICQQAKQNELQMTKEMLGKYEGQNFDMGYLGQQICAHTTMLAELRALRNVGPQEFQKLVQKGEQATQMHLEEAKKIAHSLEGKE